MQWVDRIRHIKVALIVIAILIAIASLLTSNMLTRDLQKEETNKMEVWAEAMRSLNLSDETTDLNLVLKVINGNNTIPVVVLDNHGGVVAYRNLNTHFSTPDSMEIIRKMGERMKMDGHVINIFLEMPEQTEEIDIITSDSLVRNIESTEDNKTETISISNYGNNNLVAGGDTNRFTMTPQTYDPDADYIEICYDNSLMLTRLAYYPYIQLSVVIIFVLIAIFSLFTSMKAEQNKVWVGLSKETAHQLGTPISSLMAWTEVLKENYPDDVLLPEMEKDVKRLERIAERFSKIGSLPEPKPEDICQIMNRVVEYMDKRTSNKVVINTHFPKDKVVVNIMASLFEWVMENLCKNAVDAMDGHGQIDIYLEENEKTVMIDVKDTGKGISKSHFSSVFTPGFTTKKRGWGLGLSLAKRIVEQYHKGRIFVKSSELGKGTTFRIELKK